jgi:hypothetical protein
MYASITTVRSRDPDLDATAAMAAESMVGWLRDFDGYRGLLVVSAGDSGRAHVISFWDTLDDLDRSAHSRSQVRKELVDTAGAELEDVQAYAVVHVDGLDVPPADAR